MKELQQIRQKIPSCIFGENELVTLLSGSDHRRYSLVKRAIARGEILHLRRGVYSFPPSSLEKPFHPFIVAQRLYGPSYISFGSALSFHGWIPEAVRSIISASLKRSCQFETPLGFFRFQHVLAKPFLTGAQLETGENLFLIATPWKALADYVSFYKKEWKGVHPLLHELRIDEENLEEINVKEFEEAEAAYTQKRVTRFFKCIRKDLRL